MIRSKKLGGTIAAKRCRAARIRSLSSTVSTLDNGCGANAAEQPEASSSQTKTFSSRASAARE